MIQTILLSALSAQLTYLQPTLPHQASTPSVVLTRVLPEKNYVNYVMKKNNAVQSVAQNYYGLPDYLTTVPKSTPTPTVTLVSLVSVAPESTIAVTSTPTVTQAPVVVSNTTSSISDEAITYLGNCEAGMNPAKNTGNGYYGAFQFSYGTWKSVNTGYERADLAPIEVQEAAVKQLLQRSSIYGQFPGCARRMRAAGLI